MGRFRDRLVGRNEERGAVLPLVGLCLGVLMISSALAVDIGREAAETRRLQAVADAAALDGAQQLSGGPYSEVYTKVYNAVIANAAKNHVAMPENVFTVQVGTWDPLAQQFTAVTGDNPWPNAVRVSLHDSFTNLLSVGSQSLVRSAVANAHGVVQPPPGGTTGTTTTTEHDETTTTGPTTTVPGTTTTTIPCSGGGCPTPRAAGFTLGSYGVAIQSNCGSATTAASCVPAQLLNGLLHSSLGITGVGYQGLATSNITLAGLLAANPTIGTVDSLLNSSFTSSAFGTIVANAISYCESPNPNCNASTNLAQINAYTTAITAAFSAGGGGNIQIGQFFTVAAGEVGSAASAGIDLADLVYGGAALFNGNHAVSIPSIGASVPGSLNSASASLSLISAQHSYWGPVTPTYLSAPVSDPQGSGTLTLNLSVPLAANVTVTLPYTLADAGGWLSDIGCDGGPNSAPSYFNVYVTTSSASVGNPGGGNVSLTVSGLPVHGTTTGAVGGSGGTTLTFNAPFPMASQTVNGNTVIPSLTVTLQVTGNPLIDGQLSGIAANLQTALNNSLDPVLTVLSQVAGINAGNADVDPANHMDCKAPILLPGA